MANNLGEGGVDQRPHQFAARLRNSDNDLRHYFVGAVALRTAFQGRGPQMDQRLRTLVHDLLNSGYPVNAIYGVDLNADGIVNDRPLFRGRNDSRGPGLTSSTRACSARFIFKERYRLVGLLEAENAFNHTNANCSTASGCTGAVVSTATAVDFGRVTSARTARNVQFGFKFVF